MHDLNPWRLLGLKKVMHLYEKKCPWIRSLMSLCFRAKLSMPQYLSLEAQGLLRCLFKRNPVNRLGSGTGKGDEVKSHEFFASLDFVKLLQKEIKPPYIPAPSDAYTHFYFQDKGHKTNNTVTTNTTNSSGVSSASSHTVKGDRG